jgi:hypothetical protein
MTSVKSHLPPSYRRRWPTPRHRVIRPATRRGPWQQESPASLRVLATLDSQACAATVPTARWATAGRVVRGRSRGRGHGSASNGTAPRYLPGRSGSSPTVTCRRQCRIRGCGARQPRRAVLRLALAAPPQASTSARRFRSTTLALCTRPCLWLHSRGNESSYHFFSSILLSFRSRKTEGANKNCSFPQIQAGFRRGSRSGVLGGKKSRSWDPLLCRDARPGRWRRELIRGRA